MTPEQFCYWLQGFAEIGGVQPTPEQWRAIKDHLALVFDRAAPAVQDYRLWHPLVSKAWEPIKPGDIAR